MNLKDKNSSQQPEAKRRNLKFYIYLTAGIATFTAVGASAMTVVVLQHLGLMARNFPIPSPSATIVSNPSPSSSPSTVSDPSPIPSTAAPSPSPSSSTAPPSPSTLSLSSSYPLKNYSDITWELKKCERKENDVSCSFSLTTTSERRAYDFWLNDSTKMTDREGHEYFSSKGTFVDHKAGAGSNISHEMQKGSTYAVSVDFTKIPPSISEMNSLIVGNHVKFDDVSIK